MSSAVQLPTWAAYLAGIGTPVAAFLGVIVGQLVTRRGAQELETRSRREQTMKTLQWAAEFAVSADPAKADLGLRQLQALAASNLSDSDVQIFVDAALDAVVDDVADEVEEDPEAEIDAPVVPPSHPASTDAHAGPVDVYSPPNGGSGQ